MAGPDVESFREWARAFKHTCSREGWLSRSELPLVLREEVIANQVEVSSRLVLTGFDRMTPAQEYLLDALEQKPIRSKWPKLPGVPIADTPLLVKAVDKRDEISICALWVRQELA